MTGDSFLWRSPLLGSPVDMSSCHWHGVALCESSPCWPHDSISVSFPFHNFHKTEPCVVFLGLPRCVCSFSSCTRVSASSPLKCPPLPREVSGQHCWGHLATESLLVFPVLRQRTYTCPRLSFPVSFTVVSNHVASFLQSEAHQPTLCKGSC